MQLGNGVAESGGNAGSDFVISRYSDVAGFLGSPLTITRSNGTVALAQNVTVGGAVASGFAGATGTYNFGNTGTKALQYDGTNFIFTGGPVVNNHAYTYTGYGTTTGSYFFGNTGTKYLQYDGTNFTLNGGPLLVYGTVTSIQSATTGTYNFGNSGTKYLLYDGSGFVLGGGSLLVYANVFAIATSTTGYYHFGSSGTKYLCYDGSNFIASGGPLFTTVKGYQPGGGPWADSSDARIKTVLGNYASGLNQIAALQPVRYIFKGNDTPAPPTNYPAGKPADKADEPDQPVMPYPNSNHYDPAKSNKEFIGLIAQQAEIPMPEMVTMERGFIDGMEVTDLRHLDTTPLIFALINAVKELKAKVEALETRVAPR
jgi:hypothetical protein